MTEKKLRAKIMAAAKKKMIGRRQARKDWKIVSVRANARKGYGWFWIQCKEEQPKRMLLFSEEHYLGDDVANAHEQMDGPDSYWLFGDMAKNRN